MPLNLEGINQKNRKELKKVFRYLKEIRLHPNAIILDNKWINRKINNCDNNGYGVIQKIAYNRNLSDYMIYLLQIYYRHLSGYNYYKRPYRKCLLERKKAFTKLWRQE